MAKRFERQLDGATDQTLVEPNWEGILECVDMIRGGDVPVKEALALIQRRFHSSNPHVAHHALLVLEACVKNCGKKFHTEIATKEFLDDLKNLVIGNAPDKVKEKVLELIQCWASAFRLKPEYKIVVDTHSLLRMNGFEFPAMKEADAMFMADSAPDWAEGENCYRCRVEFGVFTRKHHCRACGEIFCDKCSSKQMLLPQFGIEKRVRVCESCYDKRQGEKEGGKGSGGGKDTNEQSSTEEAAAAKEKARLAELQEQEELQLALAISQSEAEAKEQERQRQMYRQYNGKSTEQSAENVYKGIAALTTTTDFEEVSVQRMENPEEGSAPVDSVLAKYLDRDYWEKKRTQGGAVVETATTTAFRATAPPPSELSVSSGTLREPAESIYGGGGGGGGAGAFDSASVMQMQCTIPSSARALQHYQQQQQQPSLEQQQSRENSLNSMANQFQQSMGLQQPMISGEDEVAETMHFCKALREQVDTMDNRMRSNLLRGRSIINDSAIHHLFAQLTDHHANVLSRMTKLETDREYFESLQDHLAHIQESRQAVNALREEHERQIQARLLDEQRQRQQQMQQKVVTMRQKRQEMLLFQRHQALQRFQEHEQQIQQRRLHQASPHAGQPAATINYGGVQPQQPVDPQSVPIQVPMYQQQPQQHYNSPQPGQYPMTYGGGITSPPQQQQQWIPPQQSAPLGHDYSNAAYQQPQYMMPYQMPPYQQQAQPQPQPHFQQPYHHQHSNFPASTGYHQPQLQPQQGYAPMGAYPHGQMPAQQPPPQPQTDVQEDLLISFD